MDVIAASEFYRAVVTVGVDLPPHVSVGQFGYSVGIITRLPVIAVKVSLKYHI